MLQPNYLEWILKIQPLGGLLKILPGLEHGHGVMVRQSKGSGRNPGFVRDGIGKTRGTLVSIKSW